MATLKIKGDTQDAQAKVKALAKEIDTLHQKSNKTLKPKVQKQSATRAQNNVASTSTKDSFKSTVKASALGTAVGGGLMKVADFLLGGGIELAKSLTRLTTGVSGLSSKIEKYQGALEIYNEPQKEALSRGDKIDALDDERRNHNTKTNAEEFGWSRAFSNIAGVNGLAVVDKLQSHLDMATSGNMDEMDKAWKTLKPTGVTWDDIEKGNTWEVLAKMLKKYGEAGEDGVNELEPAFQQIFGKRQMGAIRKIGNGTELTRQAALLRDEYNSVITPNERNILDATAQSEIIRSKAEVHGMAIPESGIKYIKQGAQHQLESAKLNTQMLGENAGQILKDTAQQLYKDVAPSKDSLIGASMDEGKSLFNKGLGHVRELFSSFNPFTSPSIKQSSSQNIEGATKAIQNETNATIQVGAIMKDLSSQIKSNTEATNRMNNTMLKNNNNTTNNIQNNGNATAVFN